METSTSRADERPNATETARKAIATYRKLSPTMRAALRGAVRPTPKGALLVGWTGHVAARTKSALARRNIIRLSDNALTDFGRFVHAVAITSEAEVLAWAAQKDEDAKPRQGHHNRTDENGIVHRVDGHRRALCDIELEPATMDAVPVTCLPCIDAMHPDEHNRARYLGQRPDIARAAGLKGLDEEYERTIAFAESLSVEYLIRNIEKARRWSVRSAYAAERLRAYMDVLHALALAENAEREPVEVAEQTGSGETDVVLRNTATDQFKCAKDDHELRPAVAVLVYVGQGEHVGPCLCRECATCTDSHCDALGDVMDAEYDEPWCQRHADQFGPEERVSGPDIVRLDSDRYRALIVEGE